MKKLSLLLLFPLVIAITGCDSGGPEAGDDNQAPIIIGEIMPYTALPQVAEPFRRGRQLAVRQINEAGGIHGRLLQVISQDSRGNPADGVQVYERMAEDNRVLAILGPELSNVGMAVANSAKRQGLPILPTSWTDRLIPAPVTDQTPVFRLGMNTTAASQAMAGYAAGAGVTRWASVAPNYEFGRRMVHQFYAALRDRQSGLKVAAERWPAMGKLNGGIEVQAIKQANPDGLHLVIFTDDLVNFHRAAMARGLYDDIDSVVHFIAGWERMMNTFGDDYPTGWVTTGFPFDRLNNPALNDFVADYRAMHDEAPGYYSLLGYYYTNFVARAIDQADTLARPTVIRSLRQVSLPTNTPLGELRINPDTQEGNLGIYVGHTALIDGRPTMTDIRYVPGPGQMAQTGDDQ